MLEFALNSCKRNQYDPKFKKPSHLGMNPLGPPNYLIFYSSNYKKLPLSHILLQLFIKSYKSTNKISIFSLKFPYSHKLQIVNYQTFNWCQIINKQRKMLQRDKYKQDTIFRYFPNFSLQKYQQHIISMDKPFYKLAFNMQQAQRWSSRLNFTNNAVMVTFTLMLVPVIWFRKFPVLKRFTSKLGRLFWSLGLIFIPTNIVNYYFTSQTGQEMTMSYNMRIMDFMKYRQTGDITVMNSEIQWAEF